ncbi:unnamed protein product, partial [Rodentolepis nana]|uniref:Rho-GAP domain-containing protein n=1 Tax=Rodentolepis nana TaxID=102285 RepID=A0A0R3TJ23_RODNA
SSDPPVLVRVNHNVFRSSSGRGESQCLQILQWNAANNIVFRSSSGMLEGCHRTKRSKSRKSYTNVFRSSSGMLEECNGQKDPNTENPTNLTKGQVQNILQTYDVDIFTITQVQKIQQTYNVDIFTIMEANISDDKLKYYQFPG